MRPFSELMRLARSGDRGATGEICDVYRVLVERAAHRMLGPRLRSRYDTNDIVQSVLGDLIRELPGFEDRGERAFQGWLVAKVRNKVVSKARRRVHADGRTRETRLDTQVETGAAESGAGPADLAESRDDGARLTALLGTLEPAQRDVIGLFLDEQLSWEEIALRLSLPSADAARMRYVRAVAAVRDRWTRS